MAKPDVVLLTAITSYITNTGQTTFRDIADVFGIKIDEAIDAVNTILLTEVEDRTHGYILDFSIDAEETEDGSDVIYEPDNVISYFRTEYDDPRVYLTLGESAVSIEMIDQLLKLVGADSESAQSLHTVRDKIRSATNGTIGAEAPVPRASEDVLEAIWEALREARQLTFDYHSAGPTREKVTTRTVIPCAVVSEAEGYLAALQDTRNLRWFRLDRISHATTGPTVTQTDVNRARRTLRRHPALHPSEGFSVTFTTKPQAIWFAESTPGATVVDRGDTIEITFQAVATHWVRNCAVKIGTDLLDISPRSVKQDVLDQVAIIREAQET